MSKRFISVLILLLGGLILVCWALWPQPQPPVLRLGSTTSTKDSGLLDALIPLYEREFNVEIIVLAKGTGAAIRDGLAGRVDALLVHNQAREEALVADGYALSRLPIMSNDLLIVGSKDQLGYKNLGSLVNALARGERGLFLSRGDESGTHAAELKMWAAFNHDPAGFGDWYRKTGTGMGQTLITANANGTATLVDSATWARHGDRDALHIWHTGTGEMAESLQNPYGYLALNPAKVPGVDADLAQHFGAWLAGPAGQAAIAAYTIKGQQAFRPHF